jgi:multiple sugar transport system permease protein
LRQKLSLASRSALSQFVLQVALRLALALLVMDAKRGQGSFRIVAILPVVLSPAIVGMIFQLRAATL